MRIDRSMDFFPFVCGCVSVYGDNCSSESPASARQLGKASLLITFLVFTLQ